MSERVGFSVDDGVGDMMVELAGGERKRGEWLSQLVKDIYTSQQRSERSILERIEARLILLDERLERLERKIGA